MSLCPKGERRTVVVGRQVRGSSLSWWGWHPAVLLLSDHLYLGCCSESSSFSFSICSQQSFGSLTHSEQQEKRREAGGGCFLCCCFSSPCSPCYCTYKEQVKFRIGWEVPCHTPTHRLFKLQFYSRRSNCTLVTMINGNRKRQVLQGEGNTLYYAHWYSWKDPGTLSGWVPCSVAHILCWWVWARAVPLPAAARRCCSGPWIIGESAGEKTVENRR